MSNVCSFRSKYLFLLDFVLGVPSRALSQVGAPACPAPSIDTTGWTRVSADSVLIDILLPPDLVKMHYEITIGHPAPHQEWRRDPFSRFAVKRLAGPDSLKRAGIFRQASYEDYSECVEEIHGRPTLIQALKGSGTIVREGKETKSYDVYASVQVHPGLYVRIFATGPSRSDQEQFLAMVRTIRVR